MWLCCVCLLEILIPHIVFYVTMSLATKILIDIGFHPLNATFILTHAQRGMIFQKETRRR